MYIYTTALLTTVLSIAPIPNAVCLSTFLIILLCQFICALSISLNLLWGGSWFQLWSWIGGFPAILTNSAYSSVKEPRVVVYPVILGDLQQCTQDYIQLERLKIKPGPTTCKVCSLSCILSLLSLFVPSIPQESSWILFCQIIFCHMMGFR